jgi:hypothetical protein
MSLRAWTSSEDRRRLIKLKGAFVAVLASLQLETLSQIEKLALEDNDNDDNDDQFVQGYDEGEYFVQDAVSTVLVPLGGLVQQQTNRVHRPLEDDSIQFGMMKTINDFSDSDCQLYFRFLKVDLLNIANQLWPRLSPYLQSLNSNRIEVGNRYIAHYETCLCAYLYKMSRPSRLVGDAERFFGIRKSKLSQMIICMGAALYQLAIRYLTNPTIWHPLMPKYATLIESKCGIFPNIWGFIDGTIRRTCRPIEFQELVYTRYKKCHGIKFQSVVTPDGYIACLHGPYVARRHDARILRESGLLETLHRLMPADGSNGPVFAMFGDLAYPQSIYLFGGFVNPVRNSPEARFNRRMSKVRIIVEWGFANVLRRWQHLDFQREMKIFLQPIAQQYINCAFLTNISNCFYGGATNEYFDCSTMSLEMYLSLID